MLDRLDRHLQDGPTDPVAVVDELAEAIVPFEPIVEAMRTVLRTVSLDARRRVALGRGHLGLLLPELEQIVPEAHVEPVDPSVERYLLFETVAELLRAESEQHPLLFVIDDI